MIPRIGAVFAYYGRAKSALGEDTMSKRQVDVMKVFSARHKVDNKVSSFGRRGYTTKGYLGAIIDREHPSGLCRYRQGKDKTTLLVALDSKCSPPTADEEPTSSGVMNRSESLMQCAGRCKSARMAQRSASLRVEARYSAATPRRRSPSTWSCISAGPCTRRPLSALAVHCLQLDIILNFTFYNLQFTF